MGNVYGIANPGVVPTLVSTGGDVACPAGTETTVLTSAAIIAPTPGDYFPLIWLSAAVLLGATPPTALVFAFKIGAGSDVVTFTQPPATLVANATLAATPILLGVNSGTAWVGTGSVINVTVNATGQAVTFKAGGSQALIALFRGPDA